MTNELTIFNHEDTDVRTVVIGNKVWFVAKDVCSILGLVNSRDAVTRLDDDEKQTVALSDTLSRNPNTIVVNEPGLYSLILRSDKPGAKDFKRWVTHEVLPSSIINHYIRSE
jgi:prophage antirepressor-like protein